MGQTVPSTPKYEFRSAWVATAGGLDWPYTTNATLAESSLRGIIRNMKAMGMNAVVFQIVPRGDAYYQSERLPWARRLTGVMGQDPGWDPLAVAIEEAHSLGMELHAWYNVGRMGDQGSLDLQDTAEGPRHVLFSNRDFVEVVNVDNAQQVWLSYGKPEARQWAVDNVMEIVRNYNVDAVHFDFIRYPTGGYPNDAQVHAASDQSAININAWRRNNITRFVEAVHDSIRQVKPWVKIGSTPVGHYASSGGWPAALGYSQFWQDSRRWLRERIHDYLAPQIYWDIGTICNPRFDWLVRDWMGERYERHIYVGTGPYQCGGKAELPLQIDTTRANAAHGQLHFRYQTVNDNPFGTKYALPAIVPPMDWLDMTEPARPGQLTATWHIAAQTELRLQWEGGDENDAAEAIRYAVYRAPAGTGSSAVNNVQYMIGVTGNTSFVDRPSLSVESYEYYVTALSRNNVESEPVSVQTSTNTDGTELVSTFALEQNYPNPFNPSTSIAFSLDATGHATLRIYDVLGRVVAVLVDEVRPAGTHTVMFDAANLSSGTYMYVLEQSGQRITALMTLMK
jgi:uncharacterized lipoprotein YddW (UPF0748 family)